MSMEQKDKEQMEQLIASEKYQQILDKLCDIIDMVFEEEMPSFTVLNYTHKALKDAGVTLEEIAPIALADNHFLNFTILKMNHIKSGKTMCFSKDFLIRNMIEFYFLKTNPKALPEYLKKVGLKSYSAPLKKWFTEATDTELVTAVSTSLKELKQKRKGAEETSSQTATPEDWERLLAVYPKLTKQVLKDFDEYNVVSAGIPLAEIAQKSQDLGVTFSEELTLFFQHIGELKLEGVEIRFTDLYTDVFNGKDYLVLGEFWKYGDGDKLLYAPDTQEIFCFAHEYAKLKVIKQADTMTEFVEKKLVTYLKNY
ncbi:hypothetical protein [Capnocytophaga gingivalis]|uniref:hypothetical protein n=1 Tax=Capnocytophaga gingivalis TaxID=1017 RepID=UPI002353CD00|nr:hypothetical protein [Capnocytophaga gingivalis]